MSSGAATAAVAPETGAKTAAKAPAAKAATPKAAGARAATPKAARSRGQMRQPPQPRGVPEAERRSAPETTPRQGQDRGGRRDLVATAVQAAAELTEIGLSAGARVLRDAVSRLPRR